MEATTGLIPSFSSATDIETGKAAKLEDVENATSMASRAPLKNFNGESLSVKCIINRPCTMIRCATQPITTATASVNKLESASTPCVPVATAIKENAPNGATSMTQWVMRSIISELDSIRSATGLPFSPRVSRLTPTNSAKKIIASILPSASAAIGLEGTILSNLSVRGIASCTSPGIALEKSTPTPGCNIAARIRPMVIAASVVPI